jgi:hypothetical protein
MADEEKRTLDIPWATLLPIVAALAGIIAQYKPLVSMRPAAPGEKAVEVIADQDADARLWQDPLGVAQKEKAALEADLLVKNVSPSRVQRHATAALAGRIKETVADTGEGSVLLLAVMLDSGPYLEQAESRLRARQAVLEGLSESGYVPVDGEHIGFVIEKPWPLAEENAPGSAADGSLLIAWEQCKIAADFDAASRKRLPSAAQASAPVAANGNNIERVFVLWLPAASFNPHPLGNFAALLTKLAPPQIRAAIEVKLIGPANSTGLQAMLRETAEWSASKNSKYDTALDGVAIFSARATASDKALREEAQLNEPIKAPQGPEQTIEDLIEAGVSRGRRGGLQFRRTVLTDDELLGALIDELALRQAHVVPWQNERMKWMSADHVVVLTEWDNAYGRSLAKTFEDEATTAIPPDAPKDLHHQIDFYRYMHGIDGRLPGDAPKEEKQDSQKNAGASGAVEVTEGLNQADFLRRLAVRLKQEDASRQRGGDSGLRAIGLLGSDIYDKLMILRALRPEFPDAIFFTNNYDAHFEQRDEWEDAHNLVIASPFSGTLSPERQKRLAPFRDSNQTSMYAGTLAAMGVITDLREIVRQPHIFEISRKGAEELIKVPDPASALLPNPVEADGFSAWLGAPGVRGSLAMVGIGLFLMAGWIVLSMVDRKLAGGGGLSDKIKRACASTPIWLVLGVPIILFSVAALAVSGTAVLEPLALFSGISIWPSEMLRLIALLLAVHFMIKAHIDLESNEQELTRRFGLAKLPVEKWHWRKMRIGLRRWHKEHPDWMKRDAAFTAKEAWTAYLRRNQFWPRLIRVGVLVAIYAIFSIGVFALFRAPVAPARGDAALCADLWILLPAVIGLMLLTFYVVDAIRLNSNFIRIITGGVKEWEPEISESRGRIPPLEKEDLARYYDIAFVAERTEVVAPLIWYPLIVLAVMILARSAYFDNWTWPFSLILIFTLNALWAFGAAALLRRAAEQLRAAALNSLEVLRIKSYKEPERQEMFAELIGEIRGLKKGAFAPLSEQPFVRAVILPSGGLGLIAVAQRLFENF